MPLTNRGELSHKNCRPDPSPRGAELRAVLPPSGCYSDVTITSPAGASASLTNQGELGHKNRRPDPSPRGAELRVVLPPSGCYSDVTSTSPASLGEAIALAGEAIAPAGVEEDDEVPKEAAVMAQMKPGGRPSWRR